MRSRFSQWEYPFTNSAILGPQQKLLLQTSFYDHLGGIGSEPYLMFPKSEAELSDH